MVFHNLLRLKSRWRQRSLIWDCFMDSTLFGTVFLFLSLSSEFGSVLHPWRNHPLKTEHTLRNNSEEVLWLLLHHWHCSLFITFQLWSPSFPFGLTVSDLGLDWGIELIESGSSSQNLIYWVHANLTFSFHHSMKKMSIFPNNWSATIWHIQRLLDAWWVEHVWWMLSSFIADLGLLKCAMSEGQGSGGWMGMEHNEGLLGQFWCFFRVCQFCFPVLDLLRCLL